MERDEDETFTSSQCLICNTTQNHFKLIRMIVLFLITTIIIYGASGKLAIQSPLSEKIHPHTIAKDSYYNVSRSPIRGFDVVISYYAENVPFVARFIDYLRNVSTLQRLKPFIIVYNKNSNINNIYLKQALKADRVQQLPNVGREGGTYLYHILENYHTLANHTLFTQAGIEGITSTGLEDWFSNRLEKQFNSKVGYMPLVSDKWMALYDCGINPNNNMLRLAELWALIEQTLCPPDKQAVTFRGQFLVSSKRIHNRPLQVYKYINDLLTANSTHWIHNDRRSPIGKSTPDNPFFGHIVERLWTTLFNCAKPDLLDRCRRNECACFD